jgi:hypothetical protein
MPIENVRWAGKTTANPRGRRKDFIDWCDSELTHAQGVHQSLVEQWIKWLELYRAPVKRALRSVPVEGAANFMLPIIATDSDQLYAKHVQTIHAADNIWTLKPLNERWVDAAKPLQDFLTWLDGALIKMYGVNKRVLNEMVKLGTGIYKHGWHYERRPVWTYDQSGAAVKAERIKGYPFVDHVRLSDFLFPPGSYDIDPDRQGGAQIVWERIRVPIGTLKWMAEASSPMIPNIDKDQLRKVIRFEETGKTDWDDAVMRQEYEHASSGAGVDWETERAPKHVSGGKPAAGRVVREIEIFEAHARFPTDSNDSQDDVIGWYHKPTRELMRDIYNFYHHMKRPYEVVRLFPSDGFYGIGMCEMTELFQTVQSDLFNFTHDNVLLSNSRMVVMSSGANMAPGEPFYPWKVITADGPVNEAFGIFPMNDIYPSLPMLQDQVRAMKDRRNGIGDIQMGQIESLPGRTPATTMLSLLQEGNRRPDMTIKDMRYEGLSVVGLRTLQNCQQFMSSAQDVGGQRMLKIAVDMLGLPEGIKAAEKLAMPLENAEFGVGVSITATSGSANKETEKQNYLALLQVAGQLAPQFIQLMQVAIQAAPIMPAVAETALNSALGMQELYQRLLEQYDIRNSEDLTPLPDSPEDQVQQSVLLSQLAGAGAGGVPPGSNGGAGGGAAGGSFDPSMAALFGGTQSAL